MLWIDRRGIQITMPIHRELVNVNSKILYPPFYRARIFVQYRQVAHLVARVDFVAIARKTQGEHVRPFIDILTVPSEALNPMLAAWLHLSAITFDLARHRHVIVKVTATEIRD
jgi:hypothetical protein